MEAGLRVGCGEGASARVDLGRPGPQGESHQEDSELSELPLLERGGGVGEARWPWEPAE